MIAARKAPRHNPTGSASARLSVGPWCAALNRLLRKAQFVETEDYVRERGVQLIPGRFKEEIGCAGRIVAKDPNRSRSSKCHSRLLDQISSLSSRFQSGPEQPLLDQAKVHFRNSEYGLAERYFRQAVAEHYQNVEAWLGLAASYDNLKRFEEEGRAYDVLERPVGHTSTALNILGYHHMLKAEFGRAEHALLTAQAKDL